MPRLLAGVLTCLWLQQAQPAGAADHADGPLVQMDPATDLADLYAWMSEDGKRVHLAMTVFPNADAGARFSDAAYYVFHTSSRMAVNGGGAMPLDIICGFDAAQRIRCWAGADPGSFVSGDAKNPNGIVSGNGKVRVFAGLRRDHFFHNGAGFQSAVQRVGALWRGLTFDAANCPALTPAQARDLRDRLEQGEGGAPAANSFAGRNTLAIIISVETELLTAGGPIVAAIAATRPKMVMMEEGS